MIFSQYFSSQDFANRRDKLINLMPDNSACLLLSQETIHRNHDVEYSFRQDSNFWYFTGLNEPSSALLLTKRTNGEQEIILFGQESNKSQEIWTGRRAGILGLREYYSNTLDVQSFSNLTYELEKVLNGITSLYFDYAGESYQDIRKKILRIASNKRINYLKQTHEITSELRLYKEPKEIELMRKSASINIQAHLQAIKETQVGLPEYSIQALMEYIYRKEGHDVAYGSIVAGGENATILHYVNNDSILNDGDLLLIDAGCEVEYYASDITRTFPVNNKFTAAQADIYNLVLNTQESVIKKSAENNITHKELSDLGIKELSQGLKDLNLFSESLDEIIENKLFRKYYMHGIGHWLGLDVHDQGSYIYPETNKSREFNTGMIMTVEPGLYFDPNDESIPVEYRGIGVRIEDNILKTPTGIENLTGELIKDIKSIESL